LRGVIWDGKNMASTMTMTRFKFVFSAAILLFSVESTRAQERTSSVITDEVQRVALEFDQTLEGSLRPNANLGQALRRVRNAHARGLGAAEDDIELVRTHISRLVAFYSFDISPSNRMNWLEAVLMISDLPWTFDALTQDPFTFGQKIALSINTLFFENSPETASRIRQMLSNEIKLALMKTFAAHAQPNVWVRFFLADMSGREFLLDRTSLLSCFWTLAAAHLNGDQIKILRETLPKQGIHSLEPYRTHNTPVIDPKDFAPPSNAVLELFVREAKRMEGVHLVSKETRAIKPVLEREISLDPWQRFQERTRALRAKR
jgi:hypothetical protein